MGLINAVFLLNGFDPKVFRAPWIIVRGDVGPAEMTLAKALKALRVKDIDRTEGVAAFSPAMIALAAMRDIDRKAAAPAVGHSFFTREAIKTNLILRRDLDELFWRPSTI